VLTLLFVKYVSDMVTEITELELRRNKAQGIKQGMMQDLLNGGHD